MHMRLLATASALIWSSIGSAAPTAVLQPVENWHLDYGNAQCTAATSIASDTVTFGMVPSLTGSRYRLLVSVPHAGPLFAQQSRGTVDFGRGAISSPALYFGAKGVAFSVYQFELSAADLEQARTASRVHLRSADGANFSFALSDMPAIIDALRTCTADLQRYWNQSGTRPRTAAQSRSVDVQTLFTPADYPSDGSSGWSDPFGRARDAQFNLLIGENGAVTGCEAATPTGSPLLEASFCNTVRERAKFSPARGSDGEPVRSIFTTASVNWGNENVLNTGCLWVTDTPVGWLSQCAPRQHPPIVRFTPSAPPPPVQQQQQQQPSTH
jgi:hypothetical protein